MTAEVNVFLDTSALFSGIWSSAGGARMILRLGEAGVINIQVCALVLKEIENAFRRKSPGSISYLALLLDRSGIKVTPEPGEELITRCTQLVPDKGDAHLIAAAWESMTDYFVTLDRAHFIDNPALLKEVPFPVGTPGDVLAWLRRRFLH